jgi:hypothetical protein
VETQPDVPTTKHNLQDRLLLCTTKGRLFVEHALHELCLKDPLLKADVVLSRQDLLTEFVDLVRIYITENRLFAGFVFQREDTIAEWADRARDVRLSIGSRRAPAEGSQYAKPDKNAQDLSEKTALTSCDVQLPVEYDPVSHADYTQLCQLRNNSITRTHRLLLLCMDGAHVDASQFASAHTVFDVPFNMLPAALHTHSTHPLAHAISRALADVGDSHPTHRMTAIAVTALLSFSDAHIAEFAMLATLHYQLQRHTNGKVNLSKAVRTRLSNVIYNYNGYFAMMDVSLIARATTVASTSSVIKLGSYTPPHNNNNNSGGGGSSAAAAASPVRLMDSPPLSPAPVPHAQHAHPHQTPLRTASQSAAFSASPALRRPHTAHSSVSGAYVEAQKQQAAIYLSC